MYFTNPPNIPEYLLWEPVLFRIKQYHSCAAQNEWTIALPTAKMCQKKESERIVTDSVSCTGNMLVEKHLDVNALYPISTESGGKL